MTDLANIELDEPDVPRSVVEQEVARIYARDAKVTPEALVEDARDPASPLHARFWGRSDAWWANVGRLEAARQLIRSVKYEVSGGQAPTYVNVKRFIDGKRESVYLELGRALSDVEFTEQIIANAKAGVSGWRRRLTGIAAAAPAIVHLDRAIEELGGEALPEPE